MNADATPVTQNPRPTLPPPPVSVLESDPVSDVSVAGNRAAGFVGPTPLAAAFRFVEPTWRNYISYVDMESRSGNADAARYLKIWISLSPSERRVHMPEQICELATVSHADLIRWVSGQVWQEGSAKAAMCMSFMRPKVLEKTAEYAMASPDNYKHADLFMRSSGLLPAAGSRGGTPITIFNAPVASSSSIAGIKTETAPTHATGLRSMDEEIVELSRVMQQGNVPRYGDPDPDDEDDDEDPDNDED